MHVAFCVTWHYRRYIIDTPRFSPHRPVLVFPHFPPHPCLCSPISHPTRACVPLCLTPPVLVFPHFSPCTCGCVPSSTGIYERTLVMSVLKRLLWPFLRQYHALHVYLCLRILWQTHVVLLHPATLHAWPINWYFGIGATSAQYEFRWIRVRLALSPLR